MLVLVLLGGAYFVFVSFIFSGTTFVFKPPKHANGVKVVDYARHDLRPVRLFERVIDLVSGEHFDNLLQDTPTEMRPPSVILFDGSVSCPNANRQLRFTTMAESKLPSRERLLIATYDIDVNPYRAWYKFTPEMDLQKRYKTKCGDIVYVPRGDVCNGFIEWCVKPKNPLDPEGLSRVGCEDYVDKCAELVKIYNPSKDGDNWVDWLMKLVDEDGEPEISPILGSYQDQNKWLRDRDVTTTDNELRNYYLVEAFPAFSERGYLALPTPQKIQDWAIDFWNRRKRTRYTETWHAASTQLSFHEIPTTFVSLDQESHARDKMAKEVMTKIVEDWSNMRPLELTSFYGIREYKKGSWLRNHIDRIETHVLSVTFTLAKQNETDEDQLLSLDEVKKQKPWALEMISFDGERHRYDHLPGTMALYESSKVPHGRPYHNPGSGHLGMFLHYKPKNMKATDAKAWEDVAQFAAKNQEHNSYFGTYRTSEIREPTRPVFTKTNYGDGTGFVSSKGDKNKKKKSAKKETYSITVKNDADRLLDLAWLSPNGELIIQGSVAAGGTMALESYIGHKFVWVEAGTMTRVPKGQFEVEAGSRHYSYTAVLQ